MTAVQKQKERAHIKKTPGEKIVFQKTAKKRAVNREKKESHTKPTQKKQQAERSHPK